MLGREVLVREASQRDHHFGLSEQPHKSVGNGGASYFSSRLHSFKLAIRLGSKKVAQVPITLWLRIMKRRESEQF